ncbi:hypothetical protein QFC22_006227 [Naganishia vaughanmartiniae]|uniref:Uncharacterized protein n=1 Tax=Naganishia vaughanmartiniae TaxID=1424756 RepID=A0ACC2WNI0_9TREE|nr:hypothetical protein QFC22_006227 [Naganishia vaughanmartiniae]
MSFTLATLTPKDIPDPQTPAFADLIDRYFAQGQAVIDSIPSWHKKSTYHANTVQAYALPKEKRSSLSLDPAEHWVARTSTHRLEGSASTSAAYDYFRSGLLVDHSEQEKQYIESCMESERLQVCREAEAEVWRMTYKTPPPTSPRTFVFLLLTREVESTTGSRAFINISIPFDHPSCLPKQANEKNRVRGRYISVECVREIEGGDKVEWLMATSSDAGGSIPQFLTDWSLASKVTEDVPSFVEYVNNKMELAGAGSSSSTKAKITTLKL